MIEYYIRHFCSDGYSCKYKATRVNRDNLLRYLSPVEDYGRNGTASTVVHRPPLSFIFSSLCKHVLVLDCDSTIGLYFAKGDLERRHIGYAIVESSPGRFWIITDVVGPLRELCTIARSIPGIDNYYIRLCEHSKMFTLRAGPNTKHRLPVFISNDLSNPVSLRWYTEFKSHFESDDIRAIARNRLAHQAILTGDNDIIYDPDL